MVLGDCQHLERLALWRVLGASDDLQLPSSLPPGLKALQVANMPRALCSAL
jgi:hypothetical protein